MDFLPQLQLTPFDWVFIALVTLNLHWILAVKLGKSPRMKRLNVGNWGPAIAIRTTRGLDLIEKLSRPKRFWRATITAGTALVIVCMVSFFLLLVMTTIAIIRVPPEPSAYTAPRNVLLIPGLNQFIPIWYGWVALLVTMVVHEFSHGILCRVEGVRVKSMGVALLIAPIAAFVEPDEEELFGTEEKEAKASRSARVRILSAGVIANFVVAAVALALFFGPVIGAIAPQDRLVVTEVLPGSDAEVVGFEEGMVLLNVNGHPVESLKDIDSFGESSLELRLLQDGKESDLALKEELVSGVMIVQVFEDSPAKTSGMEPSLIISGIDGVFTSDWAEFKSYMETTKDGQEITIGTNRGSYDVKLAENPDGSGTGFIGVGFSGISVNAVYIDGVTFQEFPASSFLLLLDEIPHAGVGGLITLMGLPFSGIPGFTEMGFPGFVGRITQFFEPVGWAKSLGDKAFWIANMLFWIGLINLYAGLFNCLPAVPLDGGHIFRDLLHIGFLKAFHSEERAEKVTNTLVKVMAWLIFSSLVFMIAAPYLAHGFGG